MKSISSNERLILESLQKHVVDFYTQKDQDLSRTIFSQKIFFLYLFNSFSIISKFRFGRLIAYLAIYFSYNKFHVPSSNSSLYAFGPTSNNIKVFFRLKEVVGFPDDDFEINGNRVGGFRKIIYLLCGARKLISLSGFSFSLDRVNSFCDFQLLMALVSYWFYSSVIFKHNLKIIFVANDHAPLPVGLLYASKCIGIPVCYIQHAPVNSQFPPLQYDLSVLHDRNSLNAYRLSGSQSPYIDNSNIYFISRFKSNFRPIKFSNKLLKIVGIGLSYDTNSAVLLSLLRSLHSLGIVNMVLLKRHPRDSSSYAYLKDFNDFTISFVEGDDFFERIDVAIVGNSGITIDCLHYGVPTFYLESLDDFGDDYFDFVSSGLIPRWRENDDLNFQHFDYEWRNKYAFFDSTVDMNMDVQTNKLRNVFSERFNIKLKN